MTATSTIQIAFPKSTARFATVISPILLFATTTITRSIANTTVDNRAVTMARNRAEIDTACEPRKRELRKVTKDSPADIGCRTRIINRP